MTATPLTKSRCPKVSAFISAGIPQKIASRSTTELCSGVRRHSASPVQPQSLVEGRVKTRLAWTDRAAWTTWLHRHEAQIAAGEVSEVGKHHIQFGSADTEPTRKRRCVLVDRGSRDHAAGFHVVRSAVAQFRHA